MQPLDLPGNVCGTQHSQCKRFSGKAGSESAFSRMVQTDNGTEFTNALLVTKSKHKTRFEEALIEMGIEYHRIRIATPRHNGKVERQHRTDEFRSGTACGLHMGAVRLCVQSAVRQ